jgi:hypothetical protein
MFHRRKILNNPPIHSNAAPTRAFRLLGAGSVCMWMVLAVAPLDPQQPQQQPDTDRSIHTPVVTNTPDANAQTEMRPTPEQKQSLEADNIERKKQLEGDSERLLALAKELKSDVDKTNKDTLSITVIQKAAEIEKLAHDVRAKMRLVVGAS